MHHESRADDEHDTQERESSARVSRVRVFDFLTGPLAASAVVWRMRAQGSSLISVCSRMASTAVSERRPKRFTEDFIDCYRSHEHVAWTCA